MSIITAITTTERKPIPVSRGWSKLFVLSALIVILWLPLKSAASQQAEAGKTFNATGATIYYEVKGGGAGTPLVVLNGGPGFDHSYLHCSTAWDEIAKERPVILYDQRGNGRSGALKPDQTCTLADQIQDLEDLIAHLGYRKVDVLGHSWGGFLSMAYSARHPEKIERLIICDSAAPKFSDTAFRFGDIFPEKVAQEEVNSRDLDQKEADDKNMLIYLSMLFYSEEKRDGFLANAATYKYDKRVNGLIARDIRNQDLNPQIAKFKFPVMVVTGRYDINVAPTTAYNIHQAIPGSQFVIFERSGHLPFYEEQDKFVRTVNQFLASK